MRVKLSGFGDVDRHVKNHPEFELAEEATVADLLARLGVSGTAQLTIGVNGELAGLDSLLHDGDKVMLVTPMEGGTANA